MLKEDELIEAIEISKYILEVKLQTQYDQIEGDFQIFLPFIQGLKIGTFESSFTIKAFEIVINLTKLDLKLLRLVQCLVDLHGEGVHCLLARRLHCHFLVDFEVGVLGATGWVFGCYCH